jgi:hypothetical protein
VVRRGNKRDAVRLTPGELHSGNPGQKSYGPFLLRLDGRSIATSAQTATEALGGLDALDLDAERKARVLATLDRLALRPDAAAGGLGAGVDPVWLCGS